MHLNLSVFKLSEYASKEKYFVFLCLSWKINMGNKMIASQLHLMPRWTGNCQKSFSFSFQAWSLYFHRRVFICLENNCRSLSLLTVTSNRHTIIIITHIEFKCATSNTNLVSKIRIYNYNFIL